MKLVEISGRFYEIPEEWNELSRNQLLQVNSILHSKDILHSAQLRLLKVLTGISWWRIWRKAVVDMEDKLYLTDFLTEKIELTKNPFPKYKSFYGPADNFDNLKVSEYCFADAYFKNLKSGDEDAVNFLIATLWRKGKKKYNKKLNPDGDIREPFNDNLIEYNSIIISSFSNKVKQAIILWYESCHVQLMQRHPKIFSQKNSGASESGNGMYTIIRYVASKGIHGTLPEIENMYLSTFLMELEEIINDGERFREQQTIQKMKNGF